MLSCIVPEGQNLSVSWYGVVSLSSPTARKRYLVLLRRNLTRGSIPPASTLMPAGWPVRYLPTLHMPCWQNVPGGQWLFDVHGGSSVR